MQFLALPVDGVFPWYRFKAALSGVSYTLTLRYNTRMQRWIGDIADASNNPIFTGFPLLIGRNPTGQYVIEGLPAGVIFVSDDTNLDTQATRYSFGTDHSLIYADPSQ